MLIRWKCLLLLNDNNDNNDNEECYVSFNVSTINNNTITMTSINDTIVRIEKKNSNNYNCYKFLLRDILNYKESSSAASSPSPSSSSILQPLSSSSPILLPLPSSSSSSSSTTTTATAIVYVNGHHFFQENVILQFHGHYYQEIKKFVNTIVTSNISNGYSPIKPNTFYNTINNTTNTTTTIYKVFNRQEESFQYYDSLDINTKNITKVYSFESINGGIRKFLVADYNSFFKHYCPNNDSNNSNNSNNTSNKYTASSSSNINSSINSSINSNSHYRNSPRHVYEIIRNDYPCRAYFDLEYNIQSNPNINGDILTAKWISMVIWKVHELWGIVLGKDNILVLDSSTSDKYSKHVSLIIPRLHNNDHDHHSKIDITRNEIFFRNNYHVGALVELILEDITESIEEVVTDQSSPLIVSKVIHGRTPKPMYDDLWVNNKDSSKRTCFIDLGVYTKNRMFRLLWSSKYGKDTILNHFHSDKQFYSTSSKRKLENGCSINEIKSNELKKSFIVPYNAYELIQIIESGIESKDSFLQLNLVSKRASSKLKDYKNTNEENSKIVRSTVLSSLNSNWKDWELDSSFKANNKRNESPFPFLDKFVLDNLGNRGGTQGSIASWSIYMRNKLNSHDFTSPKKEYTTRYNSYRLRYQIHGNRYCSNIGRQHKSNGIILEVDLLLATLVQLCWDNDCRNYRSNPIHVPLSLLPLYDELEIKYNSNNNKCSDNNNMKEIDNSSMKENDNNKGKENELHI